MFFTFRKIKTSISLILACCSGMYLAKAMEQPTSEKAEEQAGSLANLPADIKAYITSFLGSAKTPAKAVKNIKALSITSKEFHDLINDPLVLGSLIKAISRQFNLKFPIDVALDFKNPSSLQWLKEYLPQHPEEKEHLNQRLIEAAKESDKSLLEFLLSAEADVNQANKKGEFPLNWATLRGRKDIVELLLNAGANVNAQDGDGNTPLSTAIVGKDDKEIIELLLNARANVNTQHKYNETPLYSAVQKGNKDIVELLLNAGAKASINHATVDGKTPLSLAAEEGNKDIVKLLLQAGANVNTQDGADRTPLYWAVLQENKAIEELLREHGAAWSPWYQHQ
jgi:ankyrin repeat protein